MDILKVRATFSETLCARQRTKTKHIKLKNKILHLEKQP